MRLIPGLQPQPLDLLNCEGLAQVSVLVVELDGGADYRLPGILNSDGIAPSANLSGPSWSALGQCASGPF